MAQPISNDTLWEKLSEIDKKIDICIYYFEFKNIICFSELLSQKPKMGLLLIIDEFQPL